MRGTDTRGTAMWTDETRLRHDRSGLRYTHDLTDEEWGEIEPLIPPAKPGGNKRTVNIREIVTGLCISSARGANGGTSRKTCRLVARSTIILIDGATMGHWITSIMRST